MGRTQEPAGDYGYDEAHHDGAHLEGAHLEDPAAAARPDGAARHAPPPGRDEAAGDYGYDEAHDF